METKSNLLVFWVNLKEAPQLVFGNGIQGFPHGATFEYSAGGEGSRA